MREPKRWKMYLDDERTPEKGKWTVVRSVAKALELIEEKGFPCAISFDHDLGLNKPTGYDFVKMITDMIIYDKIDFPEGFWYTVHSCNIVGRVNINSLMVNILKYYNEKRNENLLEYNSS